MTGPAVSGSATGHSLLYIDDDPALGRFVQRQLGRLGHRVETAQDGDAGLVRLAAGGFDAVALDHYMPGRDGLDVLDAIRALPDPPPVIFVTGTSESRIAVSALKAGATDYVVKDVGGEFVELLEAAVRSAVAGVVLRREKEAADRAIVEARDRFEALAAERQVLMREVNHRVGNSLQLVAAFLHLQANGSASAETRDALNEANRRVLAIAQVHRRLYTSDDVKAVALDSYLSALVEDLRESSDGSSPRNQLSLSAAAVMIDADSAVTIGVIVTELVINALKYAYPGGSGPVRVRLEADEPDGRYRLTVADDGVGKTEGGEVRSGAASSGIGRTIIKAMASKLNTTVTYEDADAGTRAVMVFAVTEPKLAGP
ncbi:response regulator [Lichenibacterium ramalinae]|uniref:histidine kinase n=1 Tax=Lichenibacterium ramalinae TaxID=2316527 RepID=A0A4Q2RGZ7_9HYPH|nr:response regulator [Lichenibacterium ramalinae]